MSTACRGGSTPITTGHVACPALTGVDIRLLEGQWPHLPTGPVWTSRQDA